MIELGDEAYHGELVHDDPTHMVTVHLLDGTAKENPPAKELPRTVTLSCTVEGKDKPIDLCVDRIDRRSVRRYG